MVNCEFGGSFFFTLARRICELTSGAAELPGAARMLPCVRPAPERDHERDATHALSPPGAGPRPGTTQCNRLPRKQTARFGAKGTKAG